MTKATDSIRISDLRAQELFKGVDFDLIMPLLSDCTVRRVTKHETLIEAGEANHNVYLILSGTLIVHLTPDPNESLTVLKEGEAVGEISVIDHQPASAFVSAAEETKLLVIHEDIVWSLIGSSHSIANNLLVLLAKRLRHGNSSIKRVKGLIGEYEHNATIDALTGLYNRRWLDSMFQRVVQLCEKNARNLTVMMIDVDHFKAYNDKNGHLAGDIALRTIAQKVMRFLRDEDLVTRFGGEEFLVLMPGLSLEVTVKVAERLRKEIAETEIVDTNDKILPGVTISIGLAEMAEDTSSDGLIKAADNALYEAKHSGRDQVCY